MSGPQFGLTLTIDVRLVPPEQGGRTNAVIGGYRPQCLMKMLDRSEITVGLCELEPEHDILAGGEGQGRLRFDRSVADLVRNLVHPGSEFSLAEGLRIIGTARVLKVE